MDLDIEVSKLKLLKANHLSQKYALEDAISKGFPKQIAETQARITGYGADIATVKENTHPMGTVSLRLRWRASPTPRRRRRARCC